MSDQHDLDHQFSGRYEAIDGKECPLAFRPSIGTPLRPRGTFALTAVSLGSAKAPASLVGLALAILPHLPDALFCSVTALLSSGAILRGSVTPCPGAGPLAFDDFRRSPLLGSDHDGAISEERSDVGADVGCHLAAIDLLLMVCLAFDLLRLTSARKRGYRDTCCSQSRDQAGPGEQDGAGRHHEGNLSQISIAENARGQECTLHPDPAHSIAQSITLTDQNLPFFQGPAFGIRQALRQLQAGSLDPFGALGLAVEIHFSAKAIEFVQDICGGSLEAGGSRLLTDDVEWRQIGKCREDVPFVEASARSSGFRYPVDVANQGCLEATLQVDEHHDCIASGKTKTGISACRREPDEVAFGDLPHDPDLVIDLTERDIQPCCCLDNQSPKDRLLAIGDLIKQSDLIIAVWNVDGTECLVNLVVKGRKFHDPSYKGRKPRGMHVIACRSMRQALGFRLMWGDDAMATPLSYGPVRPGPAIGCEVTEHIMIDS